MAMLRCSARVVIVAAGVVGRGHGQERDELTKAFEQFMQDFNKTYSDSEKETRFSVFSENFANIEAENAKGHGSELGVNEFADMTDEEFATKLGTIPSSQPWGSVERLGVHTSSNASLPFSVDWRARGAVTPVKNQGSCGCCWAFATAGAVEGVWAIVHRRLVSVSEQQLLDCATRLGLTHGCHGGNPDQSFHYMTKNPLCSEATYRYTARQGSCHGGCSFVIPRGGVAGYRDVQKFDTSALESAVAQQPVAVIVNGLAQLFKYYAGGIIGGNCPASPNHAVLVVGYGQKTHKYWLVKNSWGSRYGLGGYVLLLRGGSDAFGVCGILGWPSYPVVSGESGGDAAVNPMAAALEDSSSPATAVVTI